MLFAVQEGGRTGLTAIVVSAFFFIALFFSPILASIPPFATGPALVLVGAFWSLAASNGGKSPSCCLWTDNLCISRFCVMPPRLYGPL
jgi:hypothetical protein